MTTVTGPTNIDPCPYCGTSDGIQQTSDAGHTQGVVLRPLQHRLGDLAGHSHLRRAYPPVDLAAAAAEIDRLRWRWRWRWRWREIIALADDAPTITNEQLRDRLLALAELCTQ